MSISETEVQTLTPAECDVLTQVTIGEITSHTPMTEAEALAALDLATERGMIRALAYVDKVAVVFDIDEILAVVERSALRRAATAPTN